MDWTAPREFPQQGGENSGGDVTLDTYRRDLVLPPAKLLSGGGRLEDNRDLHFHLLEYVCAVYCDENYFQPLSGGGAEEGLAGPQAVVGTIGAGFSRPEVGSGIRWGGGWVGGGGGYIRSQR